MSSAYTQYPQLYLHELGHNLGLAHAGLLVGTDASQLEYGDLSDAMGFCCRTRTYNAPHVAGLGWDVAPVRINATTLPVAGASTTIRLRSMSLSPTGPSHAHGFFSLVDDWTTPGKIGDVYWVQLKTTHGYDAEASPDWLNNVQIKVWNNGPLENTRHVVALINNESWTDPIKMSIRVSIINLLVTEADGTADVVCGPNVKKTHQIQHNF